MTEQETKVDALRWKTISALFSVSSLNIDGRHNWRGPNHGVLVGGTIEQAIDRLINKEMGSHLSVLS